MGVADSGNGNPEIGRSVAARGLRTNDQDAGSGRPALLPDEVRGYEPSLENMRALISLVACDQSPGADELVEMRDRAIAGRGVQESYARMFPAPRQQGIRMIAREERAIAALPHETLIVHGRGDRVIPLECGERLFRLIDRPQLHLFGKGGHRTQIEHADRFARSVGDLLAE